LVLLGSLCFWLGYVIGGHSHTSAINGQQPDSGALSAGSAAKPSASAPGAFQPQSSASSPCVPSGSDSAASPQTPDNDASQPAAAPAGQSPAASDR
jgi:hypothetical protein